MDIYIFIKVRLKKPDKKIHTNEYFPVS